MNDICSFGDLLKTFRKRRKVSQRALATKLGVHYNTIWNWERGDYLPDTRGMVLELANNLGLDAQERAQLLEASLMALSSHWLIPFQRNPFFMGRDDILHQLHYILNKEHMGVHHRSCTLNGLSGIGKTQLALEYAYRYADNYTGVFWIEAETAGSLMSSLIAIADILNLPEKQEQKQDRIMAAVTHWLNNHGDWLLIFDNIEDIESVKTVLPSARRGYLLFTSRKQSLGLTLHTLTLEPMATEEGVRFLLHRARLLDRTAPLDHLSFTEHAVAKEIVSIMGGLPLALDQAGAYIESTRCSLSDYLTLLRSSHLRLLNERDTHANHLSVMKSFELIFERLEQNSPSATALLTVCAYLSPEAIPETFFIEGASSLGPIFELLAADPFEFHAAIKALLAYSLVQRHTNTHTISLHRLVQTVLKGRLSESAQREWARRVRETICRLFPSDEATQADYLQVGERLLSHAMVCILFEEQWKEDEVQYISLMVHVASYLRKRARYAEAEALLQRAKRIGEQVLGSEHLSMAEISYELANLCSQQGQYEEAMPLFQQALRIREQTLKDQHPLVAEVCYGLAISHSEQGKYEEAESYYLRALRIWEQALEPEHPHITKVLCTLAIVYAKQGKESQAEPLFLRTLHIREQTLGLHHPLVAASLNDLGYFYFNQGKYEKAEQLSQRALNIWEQSFGPEHPRVAYVLHTLAEIYRAQHKNEEALLFYERALHILEQAQGPEHPQLIDFIVGLATLLSEQGQYDRSILLHRRVLALRQQLLGPHHLDVAESLHALAEVYQKMHQPKEAFALYQQALQIREQSLVKAGGAANQ